MNNKFYHVWYFLFGYVYYLIIPLMVISSRNWEDAPGINILYDYYKDKYVGEYILIVAGLLLFFLIGAYLPVANFKRNKIKTSSTYIPIKRIFFIAFPVFLFSQYTVYANRGHLFQGYTLDFEDLFVGTICTANMLFLFLYLYNKSGINDQKYNTYLKYILIELVIVILSFGTRMYAMISFFALLTYFHEKSKISNRKLLIVFSIVVLFILIVGIWRGNGDIDFDTMVYIAFGEPIFTWISAISMFDMNAEFPWFSFPYEILSSVVNYIPTVLLPNKGDFIVQSALKYAAPQGAKSILLTLVSNFGMIGSFFAIFYVGYIFSYIRLYWKTIFGRTYYYCACGIIPFQFFRDSCLEVGKAFCYNFLILPLILIVAQRIFLVYSKDKHHTRKVQSQIKKF
mgnify:CR=1 FL=1